MGNTNNFNVEHYLEIRRVSYPIDRIKKDINKIGFNIEKHIKF